jgi:hypothetical protein
MAKAAVRKWFGIGLAISAMGVIGAFMGIYWDPINGREFKLSDIGLMQMVMIAGGMILCIVGIVLLSLPWDRRDVKTASEIASGQDSKDAGATPGKGTDGEEE